MKVTVEKVERLMDRADVGYETANEALEAADGNLLDAIIALEREGKFGPNAGRSRAAAYSTGSGGQDSAVGQSYGASSLPQPWVDPNFTMGGEKARKSGKKGGKAKAGAQPGAGQGQPYGYGANGPGNGPYGQPGGPHKYRDESTDFEDGVRRFFTLVGKVIHGSIVNYFEIWRRGERVMFFPVILFLFCLIPWVFWVTLVLLLIGLFCGCSYRFSGPHLGKKSVNDAMEKASDFAEEIKDGDNPHN